jgi:4-amino-4-deoxy-L-arabinose transferase-like glycosyltransferase
MRVLDSSILNKPKTIRNIARGVASGGVLGICLFGHLGALGLVGPDEPRYAWIARAMANTGDWVTPRLYDQPWFEKPVLYYWSATVGFRFLHSPEWASRLPSAVGALGAALAIAWLAFRFYDEKSAWATLLIFPTTLAAIGFARAATPDMEFAAALTLAMACAAEILRRTGALGHAKPGTIPLGAVRSDYLGLIFWGAWIGIAALAKGPAAIVLAGGSLVLWSLVTRQWKHALRLAHPVAVCSFCVVALPWYALCALRNPDFVRTFLFLHNVERYVTPVFQHRQPFWFFGPILLLALFPWTALLAGVFLEGWKLWQQESWRDAPGFFFACWVAFPVLFFSLSQSKLPGYVLPAIPALSLLVAVSAVRAIPDTSRVSRWMFIALGLSWIAGLLAPMAGWLRFLPASVSRQLARQIYTILEVAAIMGILIVILALSHRRWMVLALSALLSAALVEVANRRVLPRLDPYISARETAIGWEKMPEVRDTLRSYELERSWYFGLNFYFGRELPELDPHNPDGGYVITNARGIGELHQAGRGLRVPDASGISPEAWEIVLYPAPP